MNPREDLNVSMKQNKTINQPEDDTALLIHQLPTQLPWLPLRPTYSIGLEDILLVVGVVYSNPITCLRPMLLPWCRGVVGGAGGEGGGGGGEQIGGDLSSTHMGCPAVPASRGGGTGGFALFASSRSSRARALRAS